MNRIEALKFMNLGTWITYGNADYVYRNNRKTGKGEWAWKNSDYIYEIDRLYEPIDFCRQDNYVIYHGKDSHSRTRRILSLL